MIENVIVEIVAVLAAAVAGWCAQWMRLRKRIKHEH